MKVDALTVGAVGFAAFAAYAYYKSRQGSSSTTGNEVYNMIGGQRQLVGGAVSQNTDYLKSWNIYSLWDKNAPSGQDGFYGLKMG